MCVKCAKCSEGFFCTHQQTQKPELRFPHAWCPVNYYIVSSCWRCFKWIHYLSIESYAMIAESMQNCIFTHILATMALPFVGNATGSWLHEATFQDQIHSNPCFHSSANSWRLWWYSWFQTESLEDYLELNQIIPTRRGITSRLLETRDNWAPAVSIWQGFSRRRLNSSTACFALRWVYGYFS